MMAFYFSNALFYKVFLGLVVFYQKVQHQRESIETEGVYYV